MEFLKLVHEKFTSALHSILHQLCVTLWPTEESNEETVLVKSKIIIIPIMC